jgi:hypothetical protein
MLAIRRQAATILPSTFAYVDGSNELQLMAAQRKARSCRRRVAIFASDDRLDLAKVDGAGQSVDNGRFRSNEQESAFDADCFRFLD